MFRSKWYNVQQVWDNITTFLGALDVRYKRFIKLLIKIVNHHPIQTKAPFFYPPPFVIMPESWPPSHTCLLPEPHPPTHSFLCGTSLI